MLSSKKLFIIVFMICEVLFLCVYIFAGGFLLTRNELSEKSSCKDFNHLALENEKGCWLPKRFDKVIIMVIDGLRYDFAKYNSSLGANSDKYYLNNIKVFHELISSGSAMLRPFIADAPTTTMQRLKGLTTGSLPTFIDAGQNFASEEISEDNFIDQMKNMGRRIVCLGDDTWGKLFPGRFHRSFLFPSFNVMDLDTVDNGIMKHMMEEISKPDWDVFILHFLGVDHCGHLFGPQSLNMRKKLVQMDEIVREIVPTLDKKTLFIAMGDHGMTPTGDHGGSSADEVESAFFAHSPSLNFTHMSHKDETSVAQIDLVPTISLLLGTPIPYSNLGKIIEGLFEHYHHDSSDLDSSLLGQGMRLNVMQVERYLQSYIRRNSDFPEKDWRKLQKFHSENIENNTLNLKRKSMEYLTLVKSICEENWAKFDNLRMICGIVSLSCCIFVTLFTSSSRFDFSGLSLFLAAFNVLYYMIRYLSFVSTVGMSLLSLSSLHFIKDYAMFQPSLVSLVVVLIVSSFCYGSISNSYVVFENHSASFFVVSFIFFIGISLLVMKYLTWRRVKCQKEAYAIGRFEVVVSGCLLLACVSIRLSSQFWKCREEQYWCQVTSLAHTPLSGLPREFHNMRFFTSISTLICLVLLPRKWLLYCGNLNGVMPSVTLARVIPILNGFLIAGYWALESVPSSTTHALPVSLYIPRIIYSIVALSLLLLFWNPLLIYVMPRTSVTPHLNVDSVIPHIFKKLKSQYGRRSAQAPPIVYGLATAVSAPLLLLFMIILSLVIVVAGDGMVFSILIIVTAGACCLLLLALFSWQISNATDLFDSTHFLGAAVWFMLSTLGFYTTGHQTTFSSIHWTAAFAGFEGENNAVSAALICLNTFSSHLLHGLALPLVYIAPFTIGAMWPFLLPEKSSSDECKRGEFILVERGSIVQQSLTSFALVYVAFHAIKVLSSSVAAFILKRHLMVWKIFGPHFVFEAVGFGVTCFGVLVGHFFVLRILSVLENWSKCLCEKGE